SSQTQTLESPPPFSRLVGGRNHKVAGEPAKSLLHRFLVVFNFFYRSGSVFFSGRGVEDSSHHRRSTLLFVRSSSRRRRISFVDIIISADSDWRLFDRIKVNLGVLSPKLSQTPSLIISPVKVFEGVGCVRLSYVG
ncbi:hypothetical protein SOVF_148260, partial [Spinacia oleracea]